MRQKKYVYKFTFPNGKVYIGTTCDTDTRWQYCGALYNTQAVGRAIREFGWDNIRKEIVFSDPDNEIAVLDEEKRLIELYGDNSYNHADNPMWKFDPKSLGSAGGYIHVWSIDGEIKPAQDWCKIYNRDLSNTLAKIKKYGMSPLEALTAPIVPSEYKMRAWLYWRKCGFRYGIDTSSYIVPVEDWPDSIPVATSLKDSEVCKDVFSLKEAVYDICKQLHISKQALCERTAKNPATIKRALEKGNTTLDTLIEIGKAAGYKVAFVKDGAEIDGAYILKSHSGY